MNPKTIETGALLDEDATESRRRIFLAVHRALVETYALKEAGLPLVMDYYSKKATEDYVQRVAKGARFEQDANGLVILELESEELRASILECVTPRDHDIGAMEEKEKRLDSAKSADLVALMPASDSWRRLPLEDAAIKFAVSGP